MNTTAMPAKSESGRGADFLGLLYIAVCTLGILYAPQPLLNVIREEFGTSEASAGLVMSVALLPLGIAPLLYGPLLGRVSPRSLLTGAVLLLGCSGILLFFAPSFPLLLAGRFVQGLLIPAIFTTVMASISTKYHGADLQRAMALYIGATIFGGMVGRMVAGLVSTLFDWRLALLCVAFMILPAVWFLTHLPGEPKTQPVKHRFSEFGAVLREPGVASLMLIEGCTFFVFVAIANLVPFRMDQIGGGASEFRIALMYSSYAVGMALAFGSRRVIKYFGSETKALLAGLTLYVASFLGFTVPDVTVLFGMMFLMSLGQFTEHTIAPGLINRLSTRDKGMVNGLYLAFYYGGGVLGSYVPVLVYDTWGWNVCIFMLTGMLCLALFMAQRLRSLVTTAQE